jgi:drug/metabolite transporter (DMT)-like permease
MTPSPAAAAAPNGGGDGGVSFFALALILVSAVMHASWNIAARAIKGDLGVLVSSICVAFVVLLPIAALVEPTGPLLPALPFVLATGLEHVLYMAVTGAMYAHKGGSVSFVYPVARGTGVALTAILAGPILNEKISTIGALGVAGIVAGISVMACAKMGAFRKCRSCACMQYEIPRCRGRKPAKHVKRSEGGEAKSEGAVRLDEDTGAGGSSSRACVDSAAVVIDDQGPAESRVSDGSGSINSQRSRSIAACLQGRGGSILIALCCGVIITSYSLVDKAGVRFMHPIQYITGMLAIEVVLMAPYMLMFKRRVCCHALSNYKRYIALVSTGAFGCYLIILYVLTLTQASYVTALRECSVVVGAIFGWLLLGEALTFGAVCGIASILGGLVLIKQA